MTDNARVFCSRQLKDLCFRWGVTPYYPQASLAEHVNGNLNAALRIFHNESQGRWDEDLTWFSMAFNTAMHESTKSTPDVLFLGRDLMCPLSVRWDLSPVSEDGSGKPSQSFWSRGYANLMQARSNVAKRYDARRRPYSYKVGDLVVYRLHVISSKPRNISAKLSLKWSKPLVVAKMLRPSVVLLANPDAGVIVRMAHVSQLKTYFK